MRDVLSLIGEIIMCIICVPLVLIGAFLIGILYLLFVIKEFIVTILFNK